MHRCSRYQSLSLTHQGLWALILDLWALTLSPQHAHGLAVQAAPDEKFDWVIRYQSRIRVIPLIAGGLGILGILANRLISGVRLDFSPASRSARDADIMPQSADARHLACLQYIREGLDIVSLTA